MSDQRNDSVHFPPVNGRGHRRRKVVNLPNPDRYELDPYERRALELIGDIDEWLNEQEAGRG